MATPTSYTEESLATYMHDVAGGIATVLGWTVAGNSYAEPVNETLFAYGTDDIGTVSGPVNLRKLRALARREMWRQAVATFAGWVDYSAADGQSSRDSQYQAQCIEALNTARLDCLELGLSDASNVATVGRIIHVDDPYVYLPDSERSRT